MLLPQELYEIIQREVLSDETVSQQRYSKVVMPLKGLLTGDFFNEYIRKGTVSCHACRSTISENF